MSSLLETPPERVTPELVEEITRRARRERSKALWRILQGVFANRRDDHAPLAAPPRVHAGRC
jgi:hypothetical protein